ncbi:hypothetical protein FGO68_gene16642 [Halteria grandinella]|uniref:Uncharacterized protein n=1 Tax=Halteria grandinella TaxID=5974 RepID=A0A8J8SZT6_HALGN|nr:hypothetical protein FGO68_gene16642 [Halteria grandinella]
MIQILVILYYMHESKRSLRELVPILNFRQSCSHHVAELPCLMKISPLSFNGIAPNDKSETKKHLRFLYSRVACSKRSSQQCKLIYYCMPNNIRLHQRTQLMLRSFQKRSLYKLDYFSSSGFR